MAEGGTPAAKSGAESGRTGCGGRLPSSVSLASGRSSVRSAAAITPAWAPRDEAPMGTELRTHRSDRTVAAHGCDSVLNNVISNAVRDPAVSSGGRLQTVAFKICVSIRDADPPRLGV